MGTGGQREDGVKGVGLAGQMGQINEKGPGGGKGRADGCGCGRLESP